MNAEMERNLGEQPIAAVMTHHNITARDLVSASTEQLTHKMVARACRGRRLTRNVQTKVRDALNRCTDEQYTITMLFNY